MGLFTPFDPWKNNLCTCPEKYSVSPYTGCGHACLYCYASSYIRTFYSPREKKEFIARLEKEIKKIPANARIAVANSSDPYQPLEKKAALTRKMLRVLCRYPVKLMLVTKSDLVTRDIDVLREVPSVVIAITLTSLHARVTGKTEPGAPDPVRRLRAMEKLAKFFPVLCRIDPLIPGINTGEIKNLVRAARDCGAAQVVASTYKVRPDNLNRMSAVFPEHAVSWKKLYLEQGEKRGGYRYLPVKMRQALIGRIRQITREEHMEFSSCREGFSGSNTTACDGSGLFGE